MKDPIFGKQKPVSLARALKIVKSKRNWIYQEAPSTSWFFWPVGQAWMRGLPAKGYPTGPIFVLMENEVGTLLIDQATLMGTAKKIVDAEMKGRSIVDLMIGQWRSVNRSYQLLVRRIRKTNLAKLSNSKLVNLFKQFITHYYEVETLPLSNEFLIPYSDQVLGTLGRKYPEWADAIAKRAAPEKPSFLQVEEQELKKIGKLPRPQQDAALENHTGKWFFINAGYTGCPLPTKQQLRERISQVTSDKLVQERPAPPITFDRKTEVILALSRKVGAWKDERKLNNLIGDCMLELFGREFARRLDLDYNLIRYAIPREMPQLMGGESQLVKRLAERLRHGVGWVTSSAGESIYEGRAYQRVREAVLAVKKPAEVLTGVIASPGLVRGTVKIVSHPERGEFNQGDILVTSMTRPDFVPLMKKAKAVLCDEGGLLSHAAIISRELGIPCIVGLRHAMVTLKSGERVEVDATKGVVMKL